MARMCMLTRGTLDRKKETTDLLKTPRKLVYLDNTEENVDHPKTQSSLKVGQLCFPIQCILMCVCVCVCVLIYAQHINQFITLR
jgi:hypothetical protein